MLYEEIELDEEEEQESDEEIELDEEEEQESDEEFELDEEEEQEFDEEIEFDEEQEESKEEPKERQKNLRKQIEMIPTEGANFYMANRFYYEEQNYDEAIKMYKAVIAEKSDESIVAKSLYYMAESYVKLKKLDEAISVFEDLAKRLPNHYLASSAKRRIDVLKEDLKLYKNFSGGENG